jgi:hypothetical protein
MLDEVNMGTIHVARRNQGLEHGMCARGRTALRQEAESSRDTVHVRIDRESRMPAGK